MSKRLLASARANRGRSLRPRASQPRVSAAPEAPGLEDRDSAPPVASGPDVRDEAVAAPSAAPARAVERAVDADVASPAAPSVAAPSTALRAAGAPAASPVAAAAAASPVAAAATAPAVALAAAAPPVAAGAAAPPVAERPAAPLAVPGSASDATPIEALESEPSNASRRAGADDQPAGLASELEEPAPDSDALDLIDPSSPTAAFFRREEESFPPLTDLVSEPDDHADERLVVVHQLSPETLARRARLRRIVAAVAGLAGVISVAVVAKSVLSSKPSSPAPVAMAAPARKSAHMEAQLSAMAGHPSPAREKAPSPAEPEPAAAKAAEAAPDAVKAAAEAERAAAEKAEAERAAAEKAEAERAAAEKAEAERAAAEKAEAEKAEAPAASSEDASKLKKEALSFLNRGRYKDAIEVSRAAIAADPTDALPYLYLGSALQDTGKWKDGLAAYSECVRNATKGPVHECRAMGGRK
ncbi:hypothetical protein [Sorangium sp. So ce1182]|uniref:hypothetical protein n=1 Tax=Sorangium sp. So ce1182 TaxID=3133334 RepID=UPI003F61840D